ncbi:MAG: ABC transporter permease [Actinomycetota bacterium]|jgi:NitT/TauT family transport system permease protein|nr:ABC transporter permease [Actinomycetota bacterium]
MSVKVADIEVDEELAKRMPKPPKPGLAQRGWMIVVAPLVAVGIIAGSWELAASFVSPVLVPPPQRVVHDFLVLFSRGTAQGALAISIRELYIGLFIGLVAGILLGMLIGRYSMAEGLLGPFINAANATPLNILIPLLIVWVGISSKARILFVILITFFPVLLNTAGGLRNVSRGYVEVGQTMGLNERQLLRKVILPASVPYILAGVRIGVALAVIGMIVGEMEVSNVGLGYMLNFYGQGFQTGKLLALVFLASLIGVFNVTMVRVIQRSFFKWTMVGR